MGSGSQTVRVGVCPPLAQLSVVGCSLAAACNEQSKVDPRRRRNKTLQTCARGPKDEEEEEEEDYVMDGMNEVGGGGGRQRSTH